MISYHNTRELHIKRLASAAICKNGGVISINEDRVRGITATIDSKVMVFVSKASIRIHLKLEDSEGLKTLPTAEIFEQLALIRFIQIFLNKRNRMLFPHKKTFPTPTLTQKLFIISFQNNIFTILSPQTHPSTSQPPSIPPSNQTTLVTEEATLMPHESPLQSVYSLGRDEGSFSLHELTDLCNSLSKKVVSLEFELKQTKYAYHAALTKLIKRVKKLEQTIKTSQGRRRAKVVISDDEEAEEDPSNQGRSLIEELDLDAGIYLVPPHASDQGRIEDTQITNQPEEQLGVFSAATALTNAARRRQSIENVQTYTKRIREVSTSSGGVSTASRLVSTTDISTASELDSTAGVKAKDKGKAFMHESEPPKKIKKRVQVQISVDEELAKKVFEEEQARFNLDEREEVATKVDQAHDINWSDPDVLRYHTLQNRPFSVAEVRKNMCLYLKNQGGYKMSHFKGMSYEDIRPIFERVRDQNQAFIPMGSEIEKEVMKRSEFDLQQESSKPVEEVIVQQDDVIAEQAVKESSRTAGGRRKKLLARKRAKETLSEEKEESLNIESLATKYLIVDWETQILANDKYYYQIKRAYGSVKHYKILSAMLYDFDRQDMLELYRLVMDRFQTASPEGYDLLLWGDLKILIEPNEEDEIWRNQLDWNLINWKLHNFCGVHVLGL
ncbi:hypothetical protein Tco_0821716 [Tanacetum coccineum]|uniref:Uncharacterized protein n=1 Tax=Tanacetum coccineum TaxID=301880 RepID=A0ABQ5AG11_9ASTR